MFNSVKGHIIRTVPIAISVQYRMIPIVSCSVSVSNRPFLCILRNGLKLLYRPSPWCKYYLELLHTIEWVDFYIFLHFEQNPPEELFEFSATVIKITKTTILGQLTV
jgi:hypothetical protein